MFMWVHTKSHPHHNHIVIGVTAAYAAGHPCSDDTRCANSPAPQIAACSGRRGVCGVKLLLIGAAQLCTSLRALHQVSLLRGTTWSTRVDCCDLIGILGIAVGYSPHYCVYQRAFNRHFTRSMALSLCSGLVAVVAVVTLW